jgi:hypothetical protein
VVPLADGLAKFALAAQNTSYAIKMVEKLQISIFQKTFKFKIGVLMATIA